MSNKRLNKTIRKALKHNSSGGQCLWLDAYNNAVFDEFAPTIRTTIQTSCMNFIMEIEETNKEPKICAMRGRSDGEWHESGNIVDQKRGQKEMGVLETQHNLPFRVRRLTERELFRLMDVSEEDIDKIQAAGISKTQQAKMAGNSIVVSCLYHIFRKMFIETEQEEKQLQLF